MNCGTRGVLEEAFLEGDGSILVNSKTSRADHEHKDGHGLGQRSPEAQHQLQVPVQRWVGVARTRIVRPQPTALLLLLSVSAKA